MLSAAPLLIGCGQGVGIGPVGDGDGAPRLMTSGEGIDVVAVNGNLYQITPRSGGGTLATAKLAPMFQDSATPNVEDASAAVGYVFAKRGCGRGGAAGDHAVNRSANEQSWTFGGECA